MDIVGATEIHVDAHMGPPRSQERIVPFLNLPGEVRNIIYRYVLDLDPSAHPIMTFYYTGSVEKLIEHYRIGNIYTSKTSLPGSALLRTCKKVHSEAKTFASAALGRASVDLTHLDQAGVTDFLSQSVRWAMPPHYGRRYDVLRGMLSYPGRPGNYLLRILIVPRFFSVMEAHGLKQLPTQNWNISLNMQSIEMLVRCLAVTDIRGPGDCVVVDMTFRNGKLCCTKDIREAARWLSRLLKDDKLSKLPRNLLPSLQRKLYPDSGDKKFMSDFPEDGDYFDFADEEFEDSEDALDLLDEDSSEEDSSMDAESLD